MKWGYCRQRNTYVQDRVVGVLWPNEEGILQTAKHLRAKQSRRTALTKWREGIADSGTLTCKMESSSVLIKWREGIADSGTLTCKIESSSALTKWREGTADSETLTCKIESSECSDQIKRGYCRQPTTAARISIVPYNTPNSSAGNLDRKTVQ